NVRLEPDTDSLVVTQLNAGDQIVGTINEQHNKWFEITPPDQVNFYVAKDYIEKIGADTMLADLNQRKTELDQLLSTTLSMGAVEIRKPYGNIALEHIHHNLNAIINDYPEFPEIVGKAKDFQQMLTKEYTQKKIAFLENKTLIEPSEYTEDL